MKKIIVIFLIFLSSFSFIIAYNKTDKEEINNIENVEKGIAKQFVIPNDSIISSPEALYPILFETANECKVNIFRTNISYMSNDKVKITKYILLIKNTSFYDVFRLKNGRLLNEKDTQKTNLFMSTSNTHDKNQIGTIKDFGNNNMVMVKPLNTSYESLPVNGQYFAEVSDEKAFNAFIKIFVGKVNKNIKTSFTPEDFTENSNAMGAQSSSSVVVLQYIYYVSIFIVLILLIYYIFNESKKIGIIKMHGVSNIRVWFIIVGRLVTIIFVLSIVGSLILTVFVKDTTFKFVYSTILYQLKNYVIMISISLVSYLYILNIKVSHIIKNKKDTNGIFFLNMILKVACSITLILLCASVLNQYGNIHKKQESLKNWNYSKDYGVFYPLDIGNNQQDMKNNLKIFFSSTNGQLYNIFEKMGSLLINARVYEETSLLLNKDYTGIKSLVVNTNYLRQFPVYDINNKIVTVSDYTTDWVLLVPMKYHNKENEIKEFFEQDRRDSVDYEKNFFNIKASDDIKNQHIKIIWVANNQKIFSFNPEVFKTENNTILEPIIQVITTKNSLMADRSSILGGGCTDPLKVKLIN
ncbi:bacteriocin-associated protein, partial [Clostridium sp.]|uniref:bacteriocin-associated protein n=1 Tax=Clostridium sp. TaxID=1506 RepID=UPI003EE938FD